MGVCRLIKIDGLEFVRGRVKNEEEFWILLMGSSLLDIHSMDLVDCIYFKLFYCLLCLKFIIIIRTMEIK
jgi:hypothetical protein